MRTLLLTVILATGFLSPPVVAQQDSVPVFARLLGARLDQLVADPQVARATGASTGFALLGSIPQDVLGRLSDSDLIAFADLYLRSLSRAKPGTCAATWTKGIAAGFVPLGTEMDSALAVEWVSLVEKWVWITVRRTLRGRAATPADVQAVLADYVAVVTPQEQERARRVVLRQTTDSVEICNFVKGLFGRIRRMPAPTAGPILRAMMFGPTRPT